MLAFQNSGTMAIQQASFQLSVFPFSCFLGLQSLTECLLPASSKLNDVTVHLVRDNNSGCLLLIANHTSEKVIHLLKGLLNLQVFACLFPDFVLPSR